jgi:hypothetical protein
MRSIITRVGGFQYIATIECVHAPQRLFSLALHTVWDQAKASAAGRRVVQLNLDTDGLRALRELIDSALAEA